MTGDAMTNPDSAALKTVPLFSGLTDAQLQRLASWLEVDEYDAKRPPARHHQSGYMFYIVAEGSAHCDVEGQTFGTLKPGDVFGEMAFFEPDGRRVADIVPDPWIRVFSMFGTRFREMQKELPEVAARLEGLFKERAELVRAAGGQA
jgi:signal-transduction protein with cAMP-binding, CBS, and nucleotidyltransferase domain